MKNRQPNKNLEKAMLDVLNKENLSKPYETAEDAINAMLKDEDKKENF